MQPELSRRRAITAAAGLTAAAVLTSDATAATPPLRQRTDRERFPTLTRGRPEQVGMDARALRQIDTVIHRRLGPGAGSVFPGAVVLVARNGVIVEHTAYGNAQTYDGDRELAEPRPMRPDTIFDLASVTKVTATTPAIMTLVDDGRIGLDDHVGRWLGAEFATGEKAHVTVRHLLTHTSGLWEWQPVYLHATSRATALRYVASLPLRYPVGAGRHYSDLNFMLLGAIVQATTGRRLRDYVHDRIHAPLHLCHTRYDPVSHFPKRCFAATSFGNPYERNMIATGDPYPILGDVGVDDFPGWRRYTLVGEVNDGNAAYALDGVAGHAGLFSTTADLAVYCQTLANGGGYGNRRLFAERTVREFTTDQFEPGQGLGFWTHRFADVPSLGNGGFGHSGFTGTEFTVDPARGLVVIMLTNRNHPNLPLASVTSTWTAVCDAVGESIT